MGEKLNSVEGGYACDICHELLWAGKEGRDIKVNRNYIHKERPETIWETEKGMYKFCQVCGPKAKGRRKER